MEFLYSNLCSRILSADFATLKISQILLTRGHASQASLTGASPKTGIQESGILCFRLDTKVAILCFSRKGTRHLRQWAAHHHERWGKRHVVYSDNKVVRLNSIHNKQSAKYQRALFFS